MDKSPRGVPMMRASGPASPIFPKESIYLHLLRPRYKQGITPPGVIPWVGLLQQVTTTQPQQQTFYSDPCCLSYTILIADIIE